MKLRHLLVAIVTIGAGCVAWVTVDERFDHPDRSGLSEDVRVTSTIEWEPPLFLDKLSARFTLCDGPIRANCVVDGDTFWFRGEKIRVADINAPEISEPHCSAERKAAELARGRLLVLLNQDKFSLTAGWREEDRYARKLRTVSRSGRSLGEYLVEEGLAGRWDFPNIEWCDAKD